MTDRLESLFGSRHPVALVTGSAANRVGRVVARRFAEGGYRVVIHARHSESDAHEVADSWNRVGLEVHPVFGSIADEVVVDGWMNDIVERFGRLDVVVNSAAIWEPRQLEQTTTEQLREQWESNTLGAFLVAQKAGLVMTKQTSGGSIVLIGDWAVQRPYADFAAYFVSKGSIPTMTRALAVELAERNPNVRVNAILPGPVMLDDKTPEKTQQNILDACLLRKSGTADHVAAAAVFLAEHDFITGVCLPVDGGRSIYAGGMTDAIAHPSLFK